MTASDPQIILATRTGPLAVDVARTAVIVVDMQNDFGSPGGMFDRGGVDITGIRAVIDPTARVIEAARQAGCRIAYLKMGLPVEVLPFLAAATEEPIVPPYAKAIVASIGDAVTAPDGTASRVMIQDTWNTAIVDGLEPDANDDLVVYKTRFSGFYDTDLDVRLEELGITTLVFTGCTTSVCVESTLRDASFRDYRCVLLEDCVAEPIGAELSRSNHDATVDLVSLTLGWVARSDDLIDALSAPARDRRASTAPSTLV